MNKISCEIAVMMPAYNAALFIKDALQSVLDQTEKSFLIVIADDASTDNTAEIIRDFTKKDGRIIFLENKINIGLNANFNKILDYIQSSIQCQYIALFSGDDLLSPQRLLLQKQALDHNLDADICFGPAEILNHPGAYQLASKVVGIPKQIKSSYSYSYLIKNGFPFMPNTAFMRASMIGTIRFITDFSSDLVFFIDIVMLNKKDITYINEPLMIYRRHAGGVTSNIKFDELFIGTVNFYFQLIKRYPAYTHWLLISFIYKLFGGGFRFLISKYQTIKAKFMMKIQNEG
jgi:glycosyltransferase involved in cell wall biosynthesis